MVEPIEEELASLRDCAGAAKWAGLPGDPGQPDTAAGSLVIEGATPLRIVANIPSGDLQAVIRERKPGGTDPAPALVSQAGLFGRACRVCCGLAGDADGPPASQPQPLPVATAATATAPRKVKASTAADQACDDEYDIMSPERLQTAHENYRNIMGDWPPEEAELTSEQLTCLEARVKEHRPPNVDFAIWGPHGQRIESRGACGSRASA